MSPAIYHAMSRLRFAHADHKHRWLRVVLTLVVSGSFLAAPVGAQDTTQPHDASSVPDVHPPVTSLEVRLPLSADQPQEIPAIRLTPAELADMPLTRVSTSTIVTDGVITFTGILMRDLLDYVGYFPEAVTATALNDYEIDIPASDFTDFDVLLAWQADDEVLTRHDKGPFWIIYPRDDHIRLQDIRYDYRWVWQLHRLALH